MADETNEVIQDDIENPEGGGGGGGTPTQPTGGGDDTGGTNGDDQGSSHEFTEEEKATAVKLIFSIFFEYIVAWGAEGGDRA